MKITSATAVAGWRLPRLVLVNGCFDVIHRGHVELLNVAAELGPVVVAVNSDASVRELKGPTRPINCEQDRAYVIASIASVYAAFIFPGPRLADEILLLKPTFYVKGGDYTLESLEASERAALLAVGSDIRFVPLKAGYSSTQTIQQL